MISAISTKQEALQMHRDHAMCHKYEKLYFKRLAIEE